MSCVSEPADAVSFINLRYTCPPDTANTFRCSDMNPLSSDTPAYTPNNALFMCVCDLALLFPTKFICTDPSVPIENIATSNRVDMLMLPTSTTTLISAVFYPGNKLDTAIIKNFRDLAPLFPTKFIGMIGMIVIRVRLQVT